MVDLIRRFRTFNDDFDSQILLSWSRLSEQIFRIDKWSACRG